ncbi:MAG: hypothetical protein LBM04_03400, partial [Opitutaceae bacterium]|nr:hypothetical protein [Opitutaceae bacterium]
VGWRWTKDKEGRQIFGLDAIHANVAGRYLTGCVFFEGFYAVDCADVTFAPDDLPKDDAADLRRIAHSVSLGKGESTCASADGKHAPSNANNNRQCKAGTTARLACHNAN